MPMVGKKGDRQNERGYRHIPVKGQDVSAIEEYDNKNATQGRF